jgi:CRP/FNR family cyclic AMP-dependent transcriptional regulator
MSREQMIANIPLFESLAADDLTALSRRLEEQRCESGETIFREGDEGSTLFIVEEGAVEVTRGEGAGRIELATLFPGQYFGELSLFDGFPRSATTTAVRPSLLLRLDRDDFVDFVKKDPAAALLIMAEMGERLRHANDLMATQVSRNINDAEAESLTFGQKIADRVAAFGGSWPFILIFGTIMVVWIGINILEFAKFDPYPFILLNLVLSTVAAIQAPIIMMSQNRQSTKDKLLAENDYHVNVKSELEIGLILKTQAEIFARLALIERSLARKGSSEDPGKDTRHDD